MHAFYGVDVDGVIKKKGTSRLGIFKNNVVFLSVVAITSRRGSRHKNYNMNTRQLVNPNFHRSMTPNERIAQLREELHRKVSGKIR